MVPYPVTTPSPGTFWSSMPKSWQRCSTNMSHSSNEASSRRRVIRSRAVSLPLPCWVSIRRWPPPSRACARLASSSARISVIWASRKNFGTAANIPDAGAADQWISRVGGLDALRAERALPGLVPVAEETAEVRRVCQSHKGRLLDLDNLEVRRGAADGTDLGTQRRVGR